MKNNAVVNEKLDFKIEIILGNLLRIGVITAAVIVLFGAVMFIIRHGVEYPDYHLFISEPFHLNDFSKLFSGLAAFKSIAFIELGIFALVATPVLRVMFSVFAFLYEKDYMYVLFTAIVLAVLIFSFFF